MADSLVHVNKAASAVSVKLRSTYMHMGLPTEVMSLLRWAGLWPWRRPATGKHGVVVTGLLAIFHLGKVIF